MIGDLFNYGHLKSLEKARKVSDWHICGVIADEVARKWTSPLVCSYTERKSVIERIEYVNEAWRQNSLDPTRNLMKIHRRYPRAKILLMQSHHLWQGTLGGDFIKKINGEIVATDFHQGLSRDYMVKVFYDFFAARKNFGDQPFRDLSFADIRFFQKPFASKAETLQNLRRKLKTAEIERLFVFTVRQWKNNRSAVLQDIRERFGRHPLVVRSSSLNEDSLQTSYAGHFHSELNVSPLDGRKLAAAVDRVIASYGNGVPASADDKILIQSQTRDVAMSGVVFTRNLRTNTPYYLINYDGPSARTDTVTNGSGGGKIEILRSTSTNRVDKKWRNLLAAVREIESFFQGISLDIEFAVRSDHSVVIFQVRPLAANSKFHSVSEERLLERIRRHRHSFNRLGRDRAEPGHPVLSDMAFWNPAELIGDRPNYLAYSLFNHLIMKENWNKALLPLGYSQVTGGLMVRVANKPYVHAARAFRALLPAALSSDLADRLTVYYLKKLRRHPEYHDKIEFEIVHNCFTFDLDRQTAELEQNGFTSGERDELKRVLKKQTLDIIENFPHTSARDQKSISELEQTRQGLEIEWVAGSDRTTRMQWITRLIEDCRRLGIPPFVRAARMAFISTSLLRSLCRIGDLPPALLVQFMNTLDTVTRQMDRDYDSLHRGRLDKKSFLEQYGHLRPGTYDITKLPYKSNPLYLRTISGIAPGVPTRENDPVSPDDSDLERILETACRAHDLPFNGIFLLTFWRRSIQQRELYKFIYTKNISLALEILAQTGEDLGFSREDLAHLDYYSIVRPIESAFEDERINTWRNLIQGRREEDRLDSLVSLPSLVFSEKDFLIVKHRTVVPNFVGEGVVQAGVAVLDNRSPESNHLSGKIVVLEKADPGYDWIFTKNIRGLVTKYGGAASHMAIRAAEFNIPAAIGCGEVLFARVTAAAKIVMDCKNRTIHSLGGHYDV